MEGTKTDPPHTHTPCWGFAVWPVSKAPTGGGLCGAFLLGTDSWAQSSPAPSFLGSALGVPVVQPFPVWTSEQLGLDAWDGVASEGHVHGSWLVPSPGGWRDGHGSAGPRGTLENFSHPRQVTFPIIDILPSFWPQIFLCTIVVFYFLFFLEKTWGTKIESTKYLKEHLTSLSIIGNYY